MSRRQKLERTTNTRLEGGRPTPRRAWLDSARGAAVIAMVVYHSAWDLSALRLVETVVTGNPAWNVFARLIASTFLVLSGIGLALAHRDGVRSRAFLRRLATLAGAAALVSAATAFAFPDAWVFFGILHNMVASGIIALPFLRLGVLAAAAGALTLAALPALVASPLLDGAPWLVLGLGTHSPVTNDWVPVLPWTGAALAGVAIGLSLPRRASAPRTIPVLAALGKLGRHSLVVYLLHQPLIYGACLLVLGAVGPNPAAEEAPFRASCERSCDAAGQSPSRCRAICSCTVAALRREDLWSGIARDRLTQAEAARVPALARQCLAESDGAPAVTLP